MDLVKNALVLGKPDPASDMQRAKVIEYDIKPWGSCPALVDGIPDQPVDGMGF